MTIRGIDTLGRCPKARVRRHRSRTGGGARRSAQRSHGDQVRRAGDQGPTSNDSPRRKTWNDSPRRRTSNTSPRRRTLERFATREDLKRFATKADLEHLRHEDRPRAGSPPRKTSSDFATKADLEHFATKADLERFATKEDLERFATKADLERLTATFATKEDLKNHPTRDEMNAAPRPGSRSECSRCGPPLPYPLPASSSPCRSWPAERGRPPRGQPRYFFEIR